LAAWLSQRPTRRFSPTVSPSRCWFGFSRPRRPGGLCLTPARGAAMLAPLWEHYAPAPTRASPPTSAGAFEMRWRRRPLTHGLGVAGLPRRKLVWRPERRGPTASASSTSRTRCWRPGIRPGLAAARRAARHRRVPLRAAMIRRFADLTGREEARVSAATAILGLQRNLRILGIFARLARSGASPATWPFCPSPRPCGGRPRASGAPAPRRACPRPRAPAGRSA
jgi:hypothetical protein